MTKIFFYINTIGNGGAERVIVNLSSQFAHIGYECVLVTSYPIEHEYELSKKVRRISLVDKRIEGFIKRNIVYTNRLRNLVKKEKPEVLLSFMAEPNFRSMTAAFCLRVKTIISIRNDPNYEYSTKVSRTLAKILFRAADGTIFQTSDAQKWFPKKIQDKSRIIMNQVAPQFFNIKNKMSNYFVAIGRLTEQKNYKMMIRAFSNLLKKYPYEKLLIYGEGPIREELAQLIEQEGTESSIRLMGITNDVPQVLSMANCFLLTSDYEGMPNALLEAMAVGVPCISTDCPCGGPRALIENHKNGILIPVSDEDALYDKLCWIIENEDLRNEYGNQARITAHRYTPERIFQCWNEYITEIIRS